MIVCSCCVIRADEIRAEVRLGAGCPDQVAARCGAGSRCGGCRHAVEALIDDERSRIVDLPSVGARH